MSVMVLIVTTVLRPPSPARACAVFLILYCIVASYTEVGLGDASPACCTWRWRHRVRAGAGTGPAPARTRGTPG